MKKLLLLCLVLLGGVLQVSADDLYFLISKSGWWSNNDAITEISFDNGEYTDMTQFHMYGQRWNKIAIPNSFTTIKVKRHCGSEHWNETTMDASLLSGSGDKYIEITTPDNNVTFTATTAPSWSILVFRQNIVDYEGNNGTTWTDNDMHNTSHPDGNTFIFELTKEKINASSNKNQGIRFRLKNGDPVKYNDAGNWVDDYPQIYPTSPTLDDGNGNTYGEGLAIADNTTTYYHNMTDTKWYWQVGIPSYDYEKIVLTAKYENYSGNNYRWKISADAYITKQVSSTNQYATLGCSVPLEITESNDVTAYPLTADATTGKITKGDAITVIPANEGALLENATGDNQTIRAKVLASASASSSNNLKAFTNYGNKLAQVTETGYTNYILTIKNSKVGFYMVNSNGNAMGANTAYLKVADSSSGARSAFFFDNETTGIANLNVNDNANFNADAPMYNLAGQRVGKNYKGVVIVNGKKMILK